MIAKTFKAGGVLLDKSATCPTEVRKQLYSWQMIGGMANILQETETLLANEVDYIIWDLLELLQAKRIHVRF
jgi:thiamine-phosphate pyrophosphorylase